MESLRFQGPVTALKLVGELLFAGIGRCIYVYKWKTGELLFKRQMFSLHKIHGIAALGDQIALWGAKSVLFTTLEETENGDIRELSANDWVVSVGLKLGMAFIQTAHNEVIEFDLDAKRVNQVRKCSECSILYSGQLYTQSNLCAAGTVLGGVVVWDYNTEQVKYNFTDHEGSIFYVQFSPCGKFLASCSDDRSIIVWDLETGELIGRGWGHASRIWSLDFADNGLVISVSEDCTARLWQANVQKKSLETIQVVHGHQGRNIWCLSTTKFEGDTVLVTGGGDGRIKLQNISQPKHFQEWSITDIVGQPEKGEHLKDYKRLEDRIVLTTSAGKIYTHVDGAWSRLDHTILDEYSVVRLVGDRFVVAARDGRFVVVSDGIYQFKVELVGKLLEAFPVTMEDNKPCLLLQTENKTEPYRIVDLNGETLQTFAPIQNFMITSALYHRGMLFVGSRAGGVAVSKGNEWTTTRRIFQTQDTITCFVAISERVMISCRSGHYGLFSPDTQLTPFYTNKLQRGSVERIQIQDDGTVLFFGFKTDKFFIWNSTHDYEVASEVCGGAHRAWCAEVNRADESQFELYFTKAGKLSLISKPGNQHFKQSILRTGTHGREIRGLEFSLAHQGLLASASEDTCVNLALLDKNDFIETKLSLRHHVSGIQVLHWSLCGKYLLTGGGREELIWWRVDVHDKDVYAMEIARLPTVSKSPDLRIMDFDLVETSEGSWILATGYSDSTLRLWRFENGSFSLLVTKKYRECCILNVHLIDGYLLTSATDGHLVLWHCRDGNIGEPLLRHQIHQSGVRCSAVQLIDGMIHHYSGGDDNALVAVTVNAQHEVTEVFRHNDAHSSTISSMALTDGKLYTTGCDQKVRLWSLEGQLLQSLYTSVADTGTLALQNDKLVAGGMGLALFRVE